ncbi:MAG: tetratricopeptide repeat protein, partial [bacterium]
IEINPNNWKPYRNIGNVYRIQSNYSDAIKYLKKSIKINPDNSEAHLNLGLVYNEQRNYLGMIECWQKSARLGNIDAQNALKEIGQKW